MRQLINNLELARKEIIEIINSFPKEKREKVFFGNWSLKNLVSHLSGWAQYQIDTLEKFKKGVHSQIPKGLKNSINVDFVNERASLSWDRTYQEFVDSTQKLINEYKKLPDQLKKRKIYDGKDITPAEFLKIEITHYQKTHGPQIRKVLNKTKTAH